MFAYCSHIRIHVQQKMSTYHQLKKKCFQFFEKLILFRLLVLLLFRNRYVSRKYRYERKRVCCLICTVRTHVFLRDDINVVAIFFLSRVKSIEFIYQNCTVRYRTVRTTEGTSTGTSTSMVEYGTVLVEVEIQSTYVRTYVRGGFDQFSIEFD